MTNICKNRLLSSLRPFMPSHYLSHVFQHCWHLIQIFNTMSDMMLTLRCLPFISSCYVVVGDRDAAYRFADVMVRVLDVNDNPPVFQYPDYGEGTGDWKLYITAVSSEAAPFTEVTQILVSLSTLSSLNWPLKSSSTTSRELLSQFSPCSGWS